VLETALIGLRPDQAEGALIVEVVLDAGQARVMTGKATKFPSQSRTNIFIIWRKYAQLCRHVAI
jgi:hypothetical protein